MPAPVRFPWMLQWPTAAGLPEPQPALQFTFPVTAAYSAVVALEACSLLLVA
jgi:hypothetical protein